MFIKIGGSATILAAGALCGASAPIESVDPGAVRVIHVASSAGQVPFDQVVSDAFVVQLDDRASAVVGRGPALRSGMTGLPTLDALSLVYGVRHLREQFPGFNRDDALVRGLPDLSGWFVVTFDPGEASLEEIMAAYAADPFVQKVEPIGVHPVDAVPNDANYGSQYHLNQGTDKDIDAPEGWDVETGDPSIVVAVLDTGVRYYHKDLGGSAASSTNPTAADGNMWINAAEKNGSAGVDDDGNGYVDDWIGWDFVTGLSGCWSGEDCATADNDPRDFNGHGTHCAGNVAAINNNGYAVASAAGGWNPGSQTVTGNGAKVMAMRIGYSASYLGQEVGYVRMDFCASAFYYAANNGASIASCSWGSSNSGGIAAAVDYFVASGGLIFKAAGNSNNSSADYLCGRSDVYSVAATDSADKKSSFSSYGAWVDISAPGSSIYSTYHNHASPASDYVAAISGTSMATPIVAGVAANVWSSDPLQTRLDVWTRVRDNADNIDAANPSYIGLLGSGRVNLHQALTESPPPPPPPATGKLLLVFSGSPSIPGVGVVADEDVVQYDRATDSYSLYFDGSDVGLSALSIDALAIMPGGDLLISITTDSAIAGLVGAPSGTNVDDSDLVRFTPTALGADTAGSWSFYFDGSDVSLSQNAEDVDAVAVDSDGTLLISCTGSPSVSGLSGLADEDVIRFTPTSTGAVTAGSWSLVVDGSDVGLSDNAEDVDGLVKRAASMAFSVEGAFSVAGLSGADEDVFDFTWTSLGSATAGSFAAGYDGSSEGVASGADVIAVEELP